jgi:outer membrane protein assembly factor BamE
MRKIFILLVMLGLAVMAGCAGKTEKGPGDRGSVLSNLPFVYKMTVQQGNVLSEEMVDQLALGLTKAQVRYLLGTPLLTDLFHPDRWDYTYTIKRGHKPMEVKRLTLWFQEDQLVSIEGDLQPDSSRTLASEGDRQLVVEVPDWQDNRGLINRALNKIGVKTAD